MTLPRLCMRMMGASLRGQMQYRLSFVLDVIFGLFIQGFGLLFVAIVLLQFDSVAGWHAWEVALIYGIRLTAHGLWTLCANQMHRFDQIVQNGEWDRYLIRPIPVWAQFMFSQMRLTVIIDVLLGVTTLVVAIANLNIDWSIAKVLFLVAAIVGGAALDGGIQLFWAGFTFRYMETLPIRVVFDQMQDRFANFPMNVFDRPLRLVLTWAIPLAFMAWVPASVVLGVEERVPVPIWIALGSPLVGAIVFGGSLALFRALAQQYQSSGS